MNLVEKTNVQGEEEFLFAPYSVFTVLSVTMPASGKPTATYPVVIELQAARLNICAIGGVILHQGLLDVIDVAALPWGTHSVIED